MSGAPLLSVLMAAHNAAPYLHDAVGSILAQTYRDWEFLIIDDASTDATPALLREYRDPRIRIITNETNLGLTASLNRGLSESRGEWIARQDADDISAPERLSIQAGFLSINPFVAAVGSQCTLMDASGHVLGRKDFPQTSIGIRWSLLWDNALAHSAVMFRKAVVLAEGGYDQRFRASQDYDLWSRLCERHALANVPERLQKLRIVDTSITRQHRQPELIRRIQAAHWDRLFPGRVADAEALDLIGLLRSAVPVDRLEAFHNLFSELLQSYVVSTPGARQSSDLYRAVSMQYERLGYNLLTEDRGAGWRFLLRAARIWPPRVIAIPWLRAAALTALGGNARALYERLFLRQKSRH